MNSCMPPLNNLIELLNSDSELRSFIKKALEVRLDMLNDQPEIPTQQEEADMATLAWILERI